MTYADVCDLWTAEFSRRRERSTDPTLDLAWLLADVPDDRRLLADAGDLADLPSLVFQRPFRRSTESLVALAPSREVLELAEPVAGLFRSAEPTVYGRGPVVAWMFEQSSAAVLAIGADARPLEVLSAITSAMCWVW